MKENEISKPETRTTPYDGKKALIVGDHPHADTVAICKRAELFGGSKWGLVFEAIDSNQSFAVFEPKNVKWIQP